MFRPRESVWLQHAPPGLARHDEATGWTMLAGDKCIGRGETEELGLVFTHYAYVFEEQVSGSGRSRAVPAKFLVALLLRAMSRPGSVCCVIPVRGVLTTCDRDNVVDGRQRDTSISLPVFRPI